MWYKSESECRREGERAFERDKYSSKRNPYESHFASPDGPRHHRSWDEGFEYAKRRDEKRREEERSRKLAEARRRHEKEIERRRQEEKYRDEREYERQQEELGEEPSEE